MRRAVVTSVTVVWLVLAAGCGSGGLGGKSAQDVLSAATAAANAEGSFHFVDRNTSGSATQVLVGDTSAHSGQEVLTGAPSGRLEARLVGGVAYLDAASSVLQNVLGLSASSALSYAGRWISISGNEAPYSRIAHSLSPSAELTPYLPQGALSLGPETTIKGIHVLPVSGSAASTPSGTSGARATLYVSTRSPYVPVAGVLSSSDVHGRRRTDEAAFTRWGESVDPRVPAGAEPLSSIPS